MTLPQPKACLSIEELSIGMRAEKTYTISHDDAVRFSEMSGDWNPAHHDEDYAAQSFFKQRVAHGMFSVIQFSGLLGMDLPGLGTLWIKQSVEFLRPAFFGSEYKAIIEITAIDVERNTVTLSTECFDGEGNKIITGEGQVKPIPAKLKRKNER